MTTKLVLARYKEDISWSEEFKNNRVVYDKSGTNTNPEFINLENTGREAGTYLQYILDNYDNLPDVTIFSQADPGCINMSAVLHGQDKGCSICEHPIDQNIKKYFETVDNPNFNQIDIYRQLIKNNSIVKELGYLGISYLNKPLYWDNNKHITPFPEESKNIDKFNGYGLINDCFIRHPQDGIWAMLDMRVVYSYLFNNPINSYDYNDGAFFAVNKDRILFHNKDFYEKALNICNNPNKFGLSDDTCFGKPGRNQIYDGYDNTPPLIGTSTTMRNQSNIPHAFERLWKIIFDGKTT